jgi:uncharacterized RDD family membrane protein YckC
MSENPYASPAIPADLAANVVARPREVKIASQGKRFIHMFVDSIVVQLLSTAGGFVIGFAYALAKVGGGGTFTKEDENWLQMIGFMWGLLVAVAYFVVMEAVFQRTVAKLLTGTLVVNADGTRPSLKQIIGRSFARLIPFEAFSFLGGTQPVGWHDSLSGTRVIDGK